MDTLAAYSTNEQRSYETDISRLPSRKSSDFRYTHLKIFLMFSAKMFQMVPTQPGKQQHRSTPAASHTPTAIWLSLGRAVVVCGWGLTVADCSGAAPGLAVFGAAPRDFSSF